MTTPSKAQVRGGKDAIVEAAVQNFTALGYHGTSMRDIARSADVTVASIYHHFVSKQQILQDIMMRTLRDVLAATQSAVAEADGSPPARLGALMESWVLFHTTRQSEALIGASELRSLDDEGRRAVVALRDAQETVFREVIEQGVANGDFTTSHAREAGRAVINMGYSIASWYQIDGEASPAEMAARYRDLALSTVGARA